MVTVISRSEQVAGQAEDRGNGAYMRTSQTLKLIKIKTSIN